MKRKKLVPVKTFANKVQNQGVSRKIMKSMKMFSAAFVFIFSCHLCVNAQDYEDLEAQSFLLRAEYPGLPRVSEPEIILLTSPVDNFGMVNENVYRGARLTKEEQYRYLHQEFGIKTIVSLEARSDDPALCSKKYDLKCVEYPLQLIPGDDQNFDLKTFKTAYKFVLDETKTGRKVFVHCHYGSDRTGAMASAVTIRDKACNNAGFDKNALWAEVDTTLDKYGFHQVYVSLHERIKSWVFDFESNSDWICQ